MVVMDRRADARQASPLPSYTKVPGYNRLMGAYVEAQKLVSEGLIEKKVLHGVDDRIGELMKLVSADVANEKLGGRPSPKLRGQVDQLTQLLVGLSDAALDRQSAALDSDDRAAAALRDALAQIRAEEEGYRELKELEDNQ
jgi:hypothetical protein